MQQAYIIQTKRSAVTKSKKGGFRFFRPDSLAASVIKDLLSNVPTFDHALINDLIVGCANPEGEQGLQIGRQIALQSLGIDLPGMTINRYCASGLESIAIATAKIRAGMGSCFIAGGVESMSLIPMEGYKLAPNYEVAKDNPDYYVGMGLTAEAVAKKYKISREDQDAFAMRSHQLAAAAQDRGLFAEEITPIKVHEIFVEDNTRKERTITIASDEGIRRETNLNGLTQLKPAFAIEGSVTAGNSSQTSDGAAFVLIANEEMVHKYNLQPIGILHSYAVAGVDPLYMGIGPCKAIPLALKQAHKSLSEIDLIELNEAFAAQSLAVIRETHLNPEIVNVNGGAIALGHPLGCSGARLIQTLLHQLKLKNKKFGIVTACVGGGQGVAAVVESL